MKLTDRDAELLRVLGEAGVMTLEQVRKLYGGVSRYHLRRVEVMCAAGYLVRKGGRVKPLQAGLKAVGINREPPKIRDIEDEKHQLEVVDVYLGLRGWQFEFRQAAKERRRIDRGVRLDAVVSDGEVEYAVYVLRQGMGAASAARLHDEISRLPVWGIKRVAAFAPSRLEAEVFMLEGTSAARRRLYVAVAPVEELMLLPLKTGPEILVKARGGWLKELSRVLPGLEPSPNGHADYVWRGRDVVVLVTNDLIKRWRMAEDPGRWEGAVVVCLESQSKLFAEQYPQTRLVVVKDDFSGILEVAI